MSLKHIWAEGGFHHDFAIQCLFLKTLTTLKHFDTNSPELHTMIRVDDMNNECVIQRKFRCLVNYIPLTF